MSYGVKCAKGGGRNRQYRFVVNDKFCYFELNPSKVNNTLSISCRTDTLGDKITVYYLPDAPYNNLSKLELDYGIPDSRGFYFIVFGLINLLLMYIALAIAIRQQQ